MMNITELVYDHTKGYDVARPIPLDYDPRAYATKEAAARGLHAALVKLAISMGQIETEVILQTPEQSEACGCGRNWRVIWEAGPYQWAVNASMEISGPWGYTEPYYNFDLCFTD